MDQREHPQLESLEITLHRMVKMGYLDKLAGPEAQSDISSVEYRWGPRAKVEVSDEELIGFIEHVGSTSINIHFGCLLSD